MSGPVVRVALTTKDGSQVQRVDPDGPIILSIDAESSDPFNQMELHQDGSTLTAVQRVPLDGQAPVIIVEFELPSDMNVVLRGRFGELPRTYERHFEAIAGDGVTEILKHKHVNFQLYDGELVLFIKDPASLPSAVYLVLLFGGE